MQKAMTSWVSAALLLAAFPLAAVEPAAGLPRIELPPLDASKALSEDLADKRIGVPRRFGLLAEVKGDTLARGRWTRRDDGEWQWQLEVSAPGAKALDFGFRRFHLPYGATLTVHSADKASSIGPFSDRDNRPHGYFYTPLLAGDRAILELRVPDDRRALVQLELDAVNRAYRGAFGELADDGAAPKSGSCNVDVACPQGDPWRPQIASVAHYSFVADGSTFVCTGQLTADASRANNRLLTTANHCIGSDTQARSMVFYWGYENPTCRTPGSAASGIRIPLAGNFSATQSGARLLGTHVDSDFTLVQLEVEVPPAAQAIATGWDRRETVPASTFSIHHPQGHEKRISFDNDAPLLQNGPVSGLTGRLYWHILAWNLGTTEGGSSGSGLWNPDGRLIGALSGGEASCSNNVNDYYGRLSTAWEGGGTAATRVRDGLDPFNTGAQFTSGGGASLDGVVLNSAAFANPPQAGELVRFEASASGGAPPYVYEWDLDGDGEIDRSSGVAQIEASFPSARSVQVMVRVSDSGGLSGMDSRSLLVRGPRLQASTEGQPTQVCGNNDAQIDPGETWQQSVRLRNDGDAAQPAGHVLFAAAAGGLPIGPSPSGYTATTSAAGGCGFAWIDLVAGANATAALATSVGNGNAFGPLDDARSTSIALGGGGFALFGQSYASAVMSTNGYLSFNDQETGGDFSPSCTAGYTGGAAGPQLRPYHDDLVVPGSTTPAAGSGLRYRYFASCPRAPEVGGGQGCHVFSWTGMQRWNNNAPSGNFDFQAVAYESSGQIAYQYRSASPDLGAAATIGISNSSGSEVLNISCQAGVAAAAAGSAACLFAPAAQPLTGSRANLGDAVQAVPALAIGQSASVAVPFSVAADAQCGASLSFDHIATVAPGSHSFVRAPVFSGSVAANCVAASCPTIGTPPPSGPPAGYRPGLYFNPQRPGNGVLNFVYGGSPSNVTTFGGAWYSALPNRTPVWYTLQGELFGNAGEVAITRFRNLATPGSGGTAVDPQSAGRAWVGLVDGDSMLLAWELEDGRKGAEWMEPTPLPFGNPNHTQTWFNAAEPGWGLAIESLNAGGPFEFIGAFVYDNNGDPRWVVGDINSLAGGTVNLIGHRPHCPACPWIADWTSDGQPAGSLQLGYGSRTSGTLSTSIALPAPYPGVWNRSALPIIPIAEPSP